MKYDLMGVHVLNKYLWSVLKTELQMDESQYFNLVPIIPTQQEAVFNDLPSGRPFLLYTYVTSGYDTDFWANTEQVTYRIFGDQERQLRQISSLLTDVCKRYDWSADDVNDWLENTNQIPVDADDKKFDFKYITVVGGSGPEPYMQENGRQYSTVTVRMCYTHRENGRVSGNNLGLRS